MSFRQVIEKHGYPVVGKEQAEWIYRIRQGNPEVMEQKLYGVRRQEKPLSAVRPMAVQTGRTVQDRLWLLWR